MKRTWTLLALLAIVALVSSTVLAAGLSGSLVISGAQDAIDLAKLLAPAFNAKYPDIRIVTEVTSSSVGLDAIKAGKATLASATRYPKPEEGTFGSYMFGHQAVTIMVNASNPINGLTKDQIAQIFAGDIMNWSEVGGPDQDIQVMVREVGATPRTSFEAMFMGDNPLTMDAKVVGSKGGLLAEVGKTPAAIGFSTSNLDKTVKVLAVDGVLPTEENIESGAYKQTMPLLYVYKGQQPSPIAKAFLDFVASDEGKRLAKGK